MKLRDYMIKYRLTAKEFGKLCDIPHVTVWRIIVGKNPPTLKNIYKIHNATKVKVSFKDFL